MILKRVCFCIYEEIFSNILFKRRILYHVNIWNLGKIDIIFGLNHLMYRKMLRIKYEWQLFHFICKKEIIKIIVFYVYVCFLLFIRGSRSAQGVTIHWWRYSIRIENLNPEEPVTLRERHWRIFSLSGTLETVRGKGVVGQEPRLSKQYPAFQYSSHISLSSPSGHMWG
jgi:uncharacterized protein affecting Mg2+/Co2+ transport